MSNMFKMFKNFFNVKVIGIIPIFIAVNLGSFAIWLFDENKLGVPLMLGMIASCLVELDNRLLGRLKDTLIMLVVFAVCSVIIQLNINNSIIFILIFTVMAFVVTMIGAIGPRYNTVAFGTLVIAVYTVLAYSPEEPWWVTPTLIVVGATLYRLCSLCVFLLFPNFSIQEKLANVFDNLASYFLQKANLYNPDEWQSFSQQQIELASKNAKVIQAFNNCQDILFYHIRGGKKASKAMHMLKYYLVAQEIFEEVSADYFSHIKFAVQNQHTDLVFRIEHVLQLFAKNLTSLANSLRMNGEYIYDEHLNTAVVGLNNSVEYYKKTYDVNVRDGLALQNFLDNVQNMNHQLRTINQLNANNNSLPHWKQEKFDFNPVQTYGFKNMWKAIRKRFTLQSSLFRHALRLAIIVFICCSIVELLKTEGLKTLSSGYWILLTAVFVSQPNYYATKLRLKQRVIGSLLGVLVSSLLPYMQPTLILELGIIVVTTSLFFFFRQNNYSYATFFITVQVLVSFYMMGTNITDTMFIRFIDTIVGGGIAFLASSYLWADWNYLNLCKITRQALQANSKYLLLIVAQFQYGQVNPLKYRVARRDAQNIASKMANTITFMNTDPKKYEHNLGYANEILENNYALLNYISSLGVVRYNISSEAFNADFYMAFQRVIETLETMDSLTAEELNQKLDEVKALIDNNLHCDEACFLRNQLMLIIRIMPSMHKSLKLYEEEVLKQKLHPEDSLNQCRGLKTENGKSISPSEF